MRPGVRPRHHEHGIDVAVAALSAPVEGKLSGGTLLFFGALFLGRGLGGLI